METHHQVWRWVRRLFIVMSRINASHMMCGGPTGQKGMRMVIRQIGPHEIHTRDVPDASI